MKPTTDSRTRRQWMQLMESSEALLTAMAKAPVGEIAFAADRLLHDPIECQRWEQEFGNTIRRVVIPARRVEQIHLLRLTGFTWIHSAAPYRHLRDANLRGDARQRIVTGLRSGQGYARAMVAEHKSYIRSSCSHACSAHIGEAILGDQIFIASMQRYREIYSAYFAAFCTANFLQASRQQRYERSLLPMLKLQAGELRRAILAHPRDGGWLERELLYRDSTGDTQQLPRFQ